MTSAYDALQGHLGGRWAGPAIAWEASSAPASGLSARDEAIVAGVTEAVRQLADGIATSIKLHVPAVAARAAPR